ncbi:MAG: TonB-dependent receptor [Bacteroidales bacterium]|nr:TonB-dependent receptor [Bacteroidales bacterium]
MIATIVAAFMLLQVQDTTEVLGPATIYGESRRQELMHLTLGSVEVGRNYIENNFSGTLAQSLSTIPGVQARAIGSGQSKPAIRGLGFNRIAVAVDGIKHEGQQWGDDHGLEIDQFAVDRVEVIKGPGALMYGSDAIGGVLGIYTNYLPTEPFEGRVNLFGRSNNLSAGLSARLQGRSGPFYWKLHLTGSDYADYKVPTDEIEYYSYRIPLKNGTLRNTAGQERDASLILGFVGPRFRNDFKVSETWSKSGFFANAHGLEVRLSDIDYDASRRDIDLPWQSVNHLTVHNHSHFHGNGFTLDGDLAWQMNHRQERSEPVSHGYMPIPPDDKERDFLKHTLTGKLGGKIVLSEQNLLQTGVDAEFQHNRRDGWGFIIPDFETLSGGVYVTDRHTVSESLNFNGGVRYDHAYTSIHGYTDWFPTPDEAGTPVYKQRSGDIQRDFDSFTWSLGAAWSPGRWVLKANVGKSFRVPIPKELGADGVNYHIFRYEKGSPDLQPEKSYQLDAGINWMGEKLSFRVDPYLNWFPNYIYLNPGSSYYEGLQMYTYTQAQVLRTGFEAQVTYQLFRFLELEAKGEYLWARQMSGAKKGYTLPFCPPWKAVFSARYSFLEDGFVLFDVRVAGRQDQIVPPEKPTEGWYTLNLSAGKNYPLGPIVLKTGIQVENLLNRRYYDHTNYYRLIGVPEPGLNASLMLGVDF